jgi:FlaA1/EpsC-like NDP-sugar epimerase
MAFQPLPLGLNGSFPRVSYSRRIFTQASAGLGCLPRLFFTRATQMFIDASLCGAALVLSYLLRFDFAVPRRDWHTILFWLGALPILRVASLLSLGAYRQIWRYFNLDDAVVFAACNVLPSVLLLGVRLSPSSSASAFRTPLSIIICEFGAFLFFSLSIRLLRRISFSASEMGQPGYTRVLLVGSDASLASAAQRVRTCAEVIVVGLVVFDGNLRGLTIGGFPVVGDLGSLPAVLSRTVVDLVLIVDADGVCTAKTVATCTDFGVDVRIVPSPSSIIRGDMRFVRLPKPETALDEKTVELTNHVVVEAFRDRVVLVTGAGGSIGSELSRQVARLPVSTLILFDQDENSIFELRNELVSSSPKINIVSVVGDIRDRIHLERLFARTRPEVVLHAAAYKHVPVMEENCCEAVLNNVVGTRELAEIATKFHAERFLMISTDKAVHPSSVMGATKRVAELVVQGISTNGNGTRCACVRFGNVLGSRGSVVPIFLQQIAKGGPLTITDENMTRYFMTIPDAVKLVLEASTLGSRGDIYMLDMGDPIKITALAERLIKASGLRPSVDVRIQFTGVRAGEKLHEQLWAEDATVCPTEFAKLFKVLAQAPAKQFEIHLADLIEAANMRAEEAVLSILRSMPIGFKVPQEQSTDAVA